MSGSITNKELHYKTVGGISFVVPKGATVEKNKISTTGFFLSPSNFDAWSIEHHDAVHYGFPVLAQNVETV